MYTYFFADAFIFVYCCICLVYGFFSFFRHRNFLRFFLVTCLPVAGWLILGVMKLREGKPVKDIFNDEDERIQTAGITHETMDDNIFMPLQDVLLIGDIETRRKMIMNAIKRSPTGMISSLQMALSNTDTETSHYAASIIMEMQSKLMTQMQKLSAYYKLNMDDSGFLGQYAEILNQYIFSGLFDEKTTQAYTIVYEGVLDRLIALNTTEQKHYINKIELALRQGHYTVALESGDLFLRRFPDSEAACMILMKIAVESNDSSLLERAKAVIRSSPARLSVVSVAQLRYWLEAGKTG